MEKKNLFTKKELVGNIQEKGEVVWKSELEFSRYKQDCRKRALEMAAGECIELVRRGESNTIDIVDTADKYYNWLISIPNQ